MMTAFNAEAFLAEHRGVDIYEVLQKAYDRGRKDGKSEQLDKVVAELKSLLVAPDPEQKPEPVVVQADERE